MKRIILCQAGGAAPVQEKSRHKPEVRYRPALEAIEDTVIWEGNRASNTYNIVKKAKNFKCFCARGQKTIFGHFYTYILAEIETKKPEPALPPYIEASE